eukprot:5616206-Amphidinium_carterae.1
MGTGQSSKKRNNVAMTKSKQLPCSLTDDKSLGKPTNTTASFGCFEVGKGFRAQVVSVVGLCLTCATLPGRCGPFAPHLPVARTQSCARDLEINGLA